MQVVCIVGLKESGQGHEIGPLMAPSPQSYPQDTERATGFFPQALESMSQQPGAGPGQCVPTRGREPRHALGPRTPQAGTAGLCGCHGLCLNSGSRFGASTSGDEGMGQT